MLNAESLVLACFAGLTYIGVTRFGKSFGASLDERALVRSARQMVPFAQAAHLCASLVCRT